VNVTPVANDGPSVRGPATWKEPCHRPVPRERGSVAGRGRSGGWDSATLSRPAWRSQCPEN